MPMPPPPPPRVPELPIAQLLQKIPAQPAPEQNAYNQPMNQRGGLPLEIVAAAQAVYQKPMPPQGKGAAGNTVGLQPGWGGQGT